MDNKKSTVFGIINVIAIILSAAILAYFVVTALSRARISEKSKGDKEEADVSYAVYLKENDYYSADKQEENRRYISRLIDYIDTDFSYSLSRDQSFESYYSYRIEARITLAYTGTKEIIYEKAEDLYKSDKLKHSGQTISVARTEKVDFPAYDAFCTGFKEEMGIAECDAGMEVAMYVTVDGDNNIQNKKVAAISLPLVEKTASIAVSQDLLKDSDDNDKIKLFIIEGVDPVKASGALVMLIVTCVLTFIYIIYRISGRNRVSREKARFDKILKENKSYIQRISKPFSEENYQVISISDFDDLINVSDTVQQPIFMYEDKDAQTAYFYLLAEEKLLCKYAISFVENRLTKKEQADIREIHKLYSEGALANRESQRTVAKYLYYNKILKSEFGSKFIERLVAVSTATESSRQCIICRSKIAEDGIICDSCKEKMASGSVTEIL